MEVFRNLIVIIVILTSTFALQLIKKFIIIDAIIGSCKLVLGCGVFLLICSGLAELAVYLNAKNIIKIVDIDGILNNDI